LYEPKKLCQLPKKQNYFQVSKIRKSVSQKVRIILAFPASKIRKKCVPKSPNNSGFSKSKKSKKVRTKKSELV